jgi:16S rRNA G966 N2-methylase RsmD
VDPPYAEYAAVEADLQRVLVELLAPGALVVVETARRQVVVLPLMPVRVKRYGDTQVTFLEAARTPAPAAGRETAARQD